MAYDDANAVYREERSILTAAGANGVSPKYAYYQKRRLSAVHAIVVTAGTSAGAGNAAIVKGGPAGTTALATITLGTLTAGAAVDVLVGSVINPYDQLTVTNGTDTTGVALVVIETEQMPDAVRSAY
jgi:hypothetical protein